MDTSNVKPDGSDDERATADIVSSRSRYCVVAGRPQAARTIVSSAAESQGSYHVHRFNLVEWLMRRFINFLPGIPPLPLRLPSVLLLAIDIDMGGIRMVLPVGDAIEACFPGS